MPLLYSNIVKVEIAGDESRIEEWLGSELRADIGSDVDRRTCI